MIFTLLIVTILLLVAYHWAWKRSAYVQKINEIPGLQSPCVPFLGNCVDIILNVNDLYGWYKNKLQPIGGIFRLWILQEANIVFVNAKYANLVLRSAKYVPKGDFYSFVANWIYLGYKYTGQPLNREEHKQNRKYKGPLIQTPTMLQEFLEVYNKNSLILANRLKDADVEDGVEVFGYTKSCSFDIIYETVLGVPGTAQSEQGSYYQVACDELLDVALRRYVTPWLRPNFLWQFSPIKRKYDKTLKHVNDISDRIIFERREKLKTVRDDPEYRPKCFLDKSILLEDPVVDEDLRYTINGMIFAGYDTSGTAMGWFLGLMGTHPDIQDKIVEELTEVFGDSGRLPDMQDLENLKYLEMCIKESMRLFPPVLLIARKLSQDLNIENYTLPASTTILMAILGIHRNPEHYTDPEKYDPERFSVENSKHRLPGTFIPFSSGDQNCLGQRYAMIEMKCILSTILRRYRIESLANVHDLKFLFHLVLKPAKPLHIRAIERISHPYLRVEQSFKGLSENALIN